MSRRGGRRRNKKKWIAGAVQHPGAFKAKGEAAGASTAEYAREEKNAPGLLGQQARLAATLMHLNKR